MSKLSEPALDHQGVRIPSVSTSATHVQDSEKDHPIPVMPTCGEGESAIPSDKEQEALQISEDDWEHDPVNPRNWSLGKKWVRTFVTI
jgi:hypothetical protein